MRRRVACSHGSCHSVWPSPLQRQRNGGLVADVPEALPRGRRSERHVSERPRLSATGSTRRTRRTRLAHAACARQPASHASPSRGRWSTSGPGELSQVRRAMRRAARTCVRAARASGGRAKPNILSTFVFGSPAGTAAAVRRHSRGHTRTRPARKNEHAGAQPPAYMTLFSPVPPKPSAPPRPRVPPKVPGGGCTQRAAQISVEHRDKHRHLARRAPRPRGSPQDTARTISWCSHFCENIHIFCSILPPSAALPHALARSLAHELVRGRRSKSVALVVAGAELGPCLRSWRRRRSTRRSSS